MLKGSTVKNMQFLKLKDGHSRECLFAPSHWSKLPCRKLLPFPLSLHLHGYINNAKQDWRTERTAMGMGGKRLILLSSLDTIPTTPRVEPRRPMQSLHLVLCRPLWGQQPASPDWQAKQGQKQKCPDPGVLTCPL